MSFHSVVVVLVFDSSTVVVVALSVVMYQLFICFGLSKIKVHVTLFVYMESFTPKLYHFIKLLDDRKRQMYRRKVLSTIWNSE